MNLDLALILLNTAATWFMTGLIWFVQIVHYPLFDSIGALQFQNYANRHRNLTSMVVAGPMVVEIVTALLLAMHWKRADGMLLWICFALVVGVWICTALGSIPCHEKLCSAGFSAQTHRMLVTSNWARTILWTARSLILGYVMYRQLSIPASTP